MPDRPDLCIPRQVSHLHAKRAGDPPPWLFACERARPASGHLLNVYRKAPTLSDGSTAMSKLKTDLLQGTLDLMILRTLGTGPNHGWGISQRIQQVSQDVLRINQGSLYPALFRLEAQGWITSEWGSSDNNRRAKFYSLTRAGRRQLADETQNWERIAEAIARVLETA